MSNDLARLSATELLAAYRTKRLSPVEVARAALEQVRAHKDRVNAFCLVDEEAAMASAKSSEARWLAGAPCGLVDGVPTTIKDLLIAKGWPTLRGSRTIARDQPWDEDAPSVARLREQGAVFIGKTTTPEFGWKSVTDSPLTGITRNPWDVSRTTGGSSGGAAAAAALGMGALHIGTDAGGSIRIPASFCGIFGLKPTHGRVPAYPLNANSSISHAGPMARTVTDAALMLGAMTGYDPRDPYALPQETRDWRIGIDSGVARLRIAYAPTLNGAWVEPRIADHVRKAAEQLGELGAVIEEAEPPLAGAEATLMTIYRGGLAAVVNGIPPVDRAKLDPDLAALAAEGAGIGLADYFDAIKAREALSVGLNSFFQRYDALVLPAMPITAIEAGRLVPADGHYKAFYQWIPFTGPFNLTKVPAASIPCGFVDGLPAGLQVVGPMFREDTVLRICRAYESVNPIRLPSL